MLLILIEIAFSLKKFIELSTNECNIRTYGTDIFNIIFITVSKMGTFNLIMQEFTNTLPFENKLPLFIPVVIFGVFPNF
jgi:hypothetical protein